jgi:hypothetical protein
MSLITNSQSQAALHNNLNQLASGQRASDFLSSHEKPKMVPVSSSKIRKSVASVAAAAPSSGSAMPNP